MKFLTAFSFILLMAASSYAASEYPWVSFRMKDASEVIVASDHLEMNYSDGSLMIKSNSGEQILEVDNISTMQFSSSPTGISELQAIVSERSEYFTLTGEFAGDFPSAEEAQASLGCGIYIVKNSKGSFKIIF